MSDAHVERGPRRGISRRQLLAGGASAGGALAMTGALAHHAQAAGASPAGYHLQVLSTAEAALYAAMADRVFPADEHTPGASTLGFIPYLDGQLAGAWGAGEGLYQHGPFHEASSSGLGYQLGLVPRRLYPLVAQTIDAYVQRTAGATFASLPAARQDALMENLEDGKVDLDLASGPNGYTSAVFFADFLDRVNEALFADPMYGGNREVRGWEWVQYPGDPMAYGDAYWAIYPQQDDPYFVAPKGIADSQMDGMQDFREDA